MNAQQSHESLHRCHLRKGFYKYFSMFIFWEIFYSFLAFVKGIHIKIFFFGGKSHRTMGLFKILVLFQVSLKDKQHKNYTVARSTEFTR